MDGAPPPPFGPCRRARLGKTARPPTSKPMDTNIDIAKQPGPLAPSEAATKTDTARLKVFFDGGCPLCRKEIAFYQKRRGAEQIDWVDLTELNGDPAEGLSCQTALARFHVQKPDGTIVNGGRAFAEIWRLMPSFRLAGALFSSGPFAWVLDRAYDAFLPIRPHLQRFFRNRAA